MSDDSITQGSSISQIGIEFFTAVDDKPVQTAPLFTGYYPNKVAHTCQRFGVATSNQYGVKINLHSNRYWRERATGEQCDGCLYDKVMRMCKQVEAEVGIGKMMYTSTIPNMRVIQRIQERQARTQEIGISKNKDIILIPNSCVPLAYTAIPQLDGTIFVVHNDRHMVNVVPLPTNYRSLFLLLHGATKHIPPTSKISSSRGFGQEWRGTKGYGVHPPTPVLKRVLFTPTAALITALQPYRRNKTDYDIDLIVLLNLLDEYGVKYTLAHTVVDI